MNPIQHNNLIVQKSPIHGFGVFADKDFAKGEIIEECYAILSDGRDRVLFNYYFGANGKYATLTGFGFIYNHSEQPNASYYYDELSQMVIFTALQDIKKNEEIFISYGKSWFSMRKMPINKMSLWKKLFRITNTALLRAGITLGTLAVLMHLLSAL